MLKTLVLAGCIATAQCATSDVIVVDIDDGDRDFVPLVSELAEEKYLRGQDARMADVMPFFQEVNGEWTRPEGTSDMCWQAMEKMFEHSEKYKRCDGKWRLNNQYADEIHVHLHNLHMMNSQHLNTHDVHHRAKEMVSPITECHCIKFQQHIIQTAVFHCRETGVEADIKNTVDLQQSANHMVPDWCEHLKV